MMKYLHIPDMYSAASALIRASYGSVANTVIIQMQDLLYKDSTARMNTPSTLGINWKWRMKDGEFTNELRDNLRELTKLYGRSNIKKYFNKEDYMLSNICEKNYNKAIKDCTNEEIYFALLEMTKELAKEKESNKGKKKVYYISAEFLIGKLLSNNLINLGIFDTVKEELEANGKSIYEIEEVEPEPSLGNGGLGRLAACFIDSMASLGLNGDGIGLNYHMGLFKQVFENHFQKETPNPWIEEKSWLTKTDVTYDIQFNGFSVKSRLYDIDVTGYNNRTNKLHLFDIESVDDSLVNPDNINFDKSDVYRNLTLFLYPDDSVTEIVNMISSMMVAFVSISLAVSSIMIGVITYISVLERRKEIGILRAIGASKRNVSEVFNAETFIIGLCSGVMGIVLSEILLIPGNIIIQKVSGTSTLVASLPVDAALFLVALATLLTILAGIIPARGAAKCNPVKALRAE